MSRFLLIIKQAILFPLITLLLLAPLSPAYAQETFKAPCVPKNDYGNVIGGNQDVPTIQGAECLVSNVLATAVTLLGIVAFVMFLVGGFQYLTAGSNSKGVESGKNSITFAILGIVLALASVAILNIISHLTGVKTILQFNTQIENIKPQ